MQGFEVRFSGFSGLFDVVSYWLFVGVVVMP